MFHLLAQSVADSASLISEISKSKQKEEIQERRIFMGKLIECYCSMSELIRSLVKCKDILAELLLSKVIVKTLVRDYLARISNAAGAYGTSVLSVLSQSYKEGVFSSNELLKDAKKLHKI